MVACLKIPHIMSASRFDTFLSCRYFSPVELSRVETHYWSVWFCFAKLIDLDIMSKLLMNLFTCIDELPAKVTESTRVVGFHGGLSCFRFDGLCNGNHDELSATNVFGLSKISTGSLFYKRETSNECWRAFETRDKSRKFAKPERTTQIDPIQSLSSL